MKGIKYDLTLSKFVTTCIYFTLPRNGIIKTWDELERLEAQHKLPVKLGHFAGMLAQAQFKMYLT